MKLFLFALVFVVSMPANANAKTLASPEIAARSYMLIDLTANQILASKNIDEQMEPASLTKLMSAYLVFDAIRRHKITLEQALPVSRRAWKMPGSRMFIDPKMNVPVEDLIKGMVVQSGNDATVALAEGVAGSVERFVELMNEQAKSLGMANTSYKNPEGLTQAGHTTTARDLSTLATKLLQDFPEDVKYYSIKSYHYPGTPEANDKNRNTLLFRDPSVDGLKTGYTKAAGYCLISTAKRDYASVGPVGIPGAAVKGEGSRRLLSVVLGSKSSLSRAVESQKLLNWGFSAFESVKLFDANALIASPVIWKGEAGVVKVGSSKTIVVTVPYGAAPKLKTQIIRADPLVAPFSKGQQLGMLRVTNGEEVVAEIPLQALEAVKEADFIRRAWDSLRLWVK